MIETKNKEETEINKIETNKTVLEFLWGDISTAS